MMRATISLEVDVPFGFLTTLKVVISKPSRVNFTLTSLRGAGNDAPPHNDNAPLIPSNSLPRRAFGKTNRPPI